MKVLLIEDDMCAAETLSKSFKNSNIQCEICYYGAQGLEMINNSNYDIVLIDLKLPDMNGHDLVNIIRNSVKKDLPIIILSASSDINTKFKLFNSGVDEYMSKPYSAEELIMRIYAIFRRYKGYITNKIVINPGLVLDISAKIIKIDNQILQLTATEFTLLEFLIIHKDHVLTKDVIIDYLYYKDFNDVPTYKIIDVLVCKIRTKIKKLTSVNYVHTKWGIGYHIKSNNDALENNNTIEVNEIYTNNNINESNKEIEVTLK